MVRRSNHSPLYEICTSIKDLGREFGAEYGSADAEAGFLGSSGSLSSSGSGSSDALDVVGLEEAAPRPTIGAELPGGDPVTQQRNAQRIIAYLRGATFCASVDDAAAVETDGEADGQSRWPIDAPTVCCCDDAVLDYPGPRDDFCTAEVYGTYRDMIADYAKCARMFEAEGGNADVLPWSIKQSLRLITVVYNATVYNASLDRMAPSIDVKSILGTPGVIAYIDALLKRGGAARSRWSVMSNKRFPNAIIISIQEPKDGKVNQKSVSLFRNGSMTICGALHVNEFVKLAWFAVRVIRKVTGIDEMLLNTFKLAQINTKIDLSDTPDTADGSIKALEFDRPPLMEAIQKHEPAVRTNPFNHDHYAAVQITPMYASSYLPYGNISVFPVTVMLNGFSSCSELVHEFTSEFAPMVARLRALADPVVLKPRSGHVKRSRPVTGRKRRCDPDPDATDAPGDGGASWAW